MANDYEKRLLRVVDHIHDDPAGDLSQVALAVVAALSRFHFHRVCHDLTCGPAANTVRRMRLHRAAVQLVGGSVPLRTIACGAG